MNGEQWIQIVTNLFGMGGLALVVLTLHREAIRQFVRELRDEREANSNRWSAWFDTRNRQHEQVIAALAAQDKTLDRILRDTNDMRQILPGCIRRDVSA